MQIKNVKNKQKNNPKKGPCCSLSAPLFAGLCCKVAFFGQSTENKESPYAFANLYFLSSFSKFSGDKKMMC